jgi:AcrR family transcriptional regulator
MGRPRSADHDAQRERILATAVQAFSEMGYPSASMSQIAAACGTSKAGLYHYYPSKQALLFAALDAYTRRLIALAQARRSGESCPKKALASMVRAFMVEYRNARAHHMALLNDVKSLDAPQREIIRQQERAVVAIFREAISAAWPQAMASDRAMPTTMALLGMINFTFAWLRPDGAMSHEEFADLALSLWERGLEGASQQALTTTHEPKANANPERSLGLIAE